MVRAHAVYLLHAWSCIFSASRDGSPPPTSSSALYRLTLRTMRLPGQNSACCSVTNRTPSVRCLTCTRNVAGVLQACTVLVLVPTGTSQTPLVLVDALVAGTCTLLHHRPDLRTDSLDMRRLYNRALHPSYRHLSYQHVMLVAPHARQTTTTEPQP